MTAVFLIAGLVLLIAGAEFLVRGASRLAATLGVAPLIIGLTVVAFGTSAPEFAVSIKSTLAGQANIAVGNVIGSNIFNILFILGLSALICPLIISQQLIRLDVPLMVAVSAITLLLAWDDTLSRLDGILLFGGLLAYTSILISFGRKSTDNPAAAPEEKFEPAQPQWIANGLYIASGLIFLVAGSRWLVSSAVAIAEMLGVSELIIGLTIIAAGTSLPEVVTSVVASVRGERDIAVGNVVGSNLFNLMGVLGLAAILSPDGINVAPSVISFDIPIMIAVAFACLPIFFTGGVISRWEGGLLFAYYLAYTAYLVLTVTRHETASLFNSAMLYFILPLTILTLLVVSANTIRKKRRAPAGTDV